MKQLGLQSFRTQMNGAALAEGTRIRRIFADIKKIRVNPRYPRYPRSNKLFSIAFFISVLFSVTSFAKDLHFVYVRLDINSMDIDTLKAQIEKLVDSFSDSDFIVYYSNENTTMDKRSWNKNKLFVLINSQNSSIPIDIPDEIESISLPLEIRLQEESYTDIHFDCFVGREFFEKEHQNDVLARMLIVNSLLQSKYNITLKYYPCGASYSQAKIKFNPEYNINVSSKIISSI